MKIAKENLTKIAQEIIDDYEKYLNICGDNSLDPLLNFSLCIDLIAKTNDHGNHILDEKKIDIIVNDNELYEDFVEEYSRAKNFIDDKDDLASKAHYNLIRILRKDTRLISEQSFLQECFEILHMIKTAEDEDFCIIYGKDYLRDIIKEANPRAYFYYHITGYEYASKCNFDINALKGLAIESVQ